MSRDLSFWRTKKKLYIENKDIYKSLSEGKFLTYVNEIPVSQIIADFNKAFIKWINNDNKYYEKDNEAFELMTTEQFVRVDCYEMTADNMNKIIDIMIKYDCPLYDAAIDVRFDGT